MKTSKRRIIDCRMVVLVAWIIIGLLCGLFLPSVSAQDETTEVPSTTQVPSSTEESSTFNTTAEEEEEETSSPTDDSLYGLSEVYRSKFRAAINETDKIAGDYIVVFDPNAVAIELDRRGGISLDDLIRGLTAIGVTRLATYYPLSMAKLHVEDRYGQGSTRDERRVSLLQDFFNSTLVNYIQEDTMMKQFGNQRFPPWGLDRIDQYDSEALNSQYHYDSLANDVIAYVVDSGLYVDHVDFRGRATCPFSSIPDEACTDDASGHGTHVAGTIGGAVYGVAKGIQLVGIKVLNKDGSGSTSGIIEGIEYILNQKLSLPTKLMVVNMSLGGSASSALDDAVTQLVNAGIFVAVAAGNEDQDACNVSPARVDAATTVGASDRQDRRASFSNWGNCLDIFAPGVDILSTWNTGDSSAAWLSGTSMASPHIAGVAAIYLSQSATALNPAEINTRLQNNAIIGLPFDPKGSLALLVNTQSTFITIPEDPPEPIFNLTGLENFTIPPGRGTSASIPFFSKTTTWVVCFVTLVPFCFL